MVKHGGARPGSGRKPNEDYFKLREKLSVYDEICYNKILEGVTSGNYKFIELFLAYRFGRPSQHIDVTTNNESVNRVMYIPETIATQLLNDIPDGTRLDNLDNSESQDKQITE